MEVEVGESTVRWTFELASEPIRFVFDRAHYLRRNSCPWSHAASSSRKDSGEVAHFSLRYDALL